MQLILVLVYSTVWFKSLLLTFVALGFVPTLNFTKADISGFIFLVNVAFIVSTMWIILMKFVSFIVGSEKC